jgi:hypothetical protein
VRVTDIVIDLVNGNVVGIAVFETVCDTERVNGLLVAIGLGDLEYVGEIE